MEAYLTIGALVAFALLAWWARYETQVSQARKDDVEDLQREIELTEKSNEVAEVADSRRDPGLHNVPDVVPGARVPKWSKRD